MATPPIKSIAVMGGGSWATALSYLLLRNSGRLVWYLHRQDRIDDFKAMSHNPKYLSDITFDTSRIYFTSDINEAIDMADTIVMAMPSPYFKGQIEKVKTDISSKNVVSAIKGIVPDENMIVSDYMTGRMGVDPRRMLVIGGPCHAEEVALSRRSYLTVGCRNIELAGEFATRLEGPKMTTVLSTDVDGIEYSAVLKNVYAIAAGIIHGLNAGDNLLAVMVSNAIREMERFLSAVCPMGRDICQSVYLGDLLVTSYSRFSRNHNLGSMIGKGYSVKAALMEMEQTAEGYFGTRCMHLINEKYGVDMPILNAVYNILYNSTPASTALRRAAETFT